MNSQRVIFTACPNGITPAGKLRLSVAIGPQLLAAKSPATLAGFPDFTDWPATKITWPVLIGSSLSEGTVVSGARPAVRRPVDRHVRITRDHRTYPHQPGDRDDSTRPADHLKACPVTARPIDGKSMDFRP